MSTFSALLRRLSRFFPNFFPALYTNKCLVCRTFTDLMDLADVTPDAGRDVLVASKFLSGLPTYLGQAPRNGHLKAVPDGYHLVAF